MSRKHCGPFFYHTWQWNAPSKRVANEQPEKHLFYCYNHNQLHLGHFGRKPILEPCLVLRSQNAVQSFVVFHDGWVFLLFDDPSAIFYFHFSSTIAGT